MNMNLNELKNFFCKASENGYAKEGVTVTDEADGSHTIVYEEGLWRLHDNFFGGEPYAGKDIIFHNNRAVWMMLYYGWVHDTKLTPDEVYHFLRKALAKFPKDYPYRGPTEFRESSLKYKNIFKGEIDNFIGEETIYEDKKEIYRARYFGGLVDRREGY
mgnify:CR=1 FL=1